MNAENGNKCVVFTMGGKGGVGKTGLMVALAEWFEAHEIPFKLLDLDTENKARGSLKHFFNGSVTKVNIHTPAGLDAFVDHLESGASIILADMGAGSGQVASEWFDAMYEDVSTTGARFTAVGVITPDPASVESVLAWATAFRIVSSTLSSRMRRAHSQTSAIGIRPSRRFDFGNRYHQWWSGWNFGSRSWRIRHDSTAYDWGRWPRGRIRSMN